MKRKIVKQGGTALTITLPNKWAKKWELKAGDEVEVIEKGKEIIVNSKKTPSIGKITLDVSGFPSALITRHINAAYKLGYDEIEIKFDNPKVRYTSAKVEYSSKDRFSYASEKKEIDTLELIQTITDRLMGLEIIEQGKGHCIVKELAEIKEIEFKNVLRKIFLLLDSMFENNLIYLKEKDKDVPSIIFNIESNVNKFCHFCLRILNKNGYEDYTKTQIMYLLVSQLELLGDLLANFIKSEQKNSEKADKNAIEKCNEARVIFNEFYENFYKFDIEKLKSIYYKNYDNRKKISDLLNRNNSVKTLEYCQFISDSIADLIQSNLDLIF